MAEELGTGVTHEGPPRWLLGLIGIVGLIAVVGLIFGWTASTQIQQARQAVSSELQTAKQKFAQDLQSVQERQAKSDAANSDLQSELDLVTKRLRITQGDVKRAREEAAQAREDSAKQLAAMDTSVKTELAAKASADEVKTMGGQVTGIRSDLDATRKDVQMARSELGTLIARNHEEIDQLRRLGEREYTEFTLAGRNKPQKVGVTTVELRGTNTKKSQFSIYLTVDDLRVEKKNRAINEPIFFYPRGSKQPMELVINQVMKDKVVGYLSVPKALATSSSTTGR